MIEDCPKQSRTPPLKCPKAAQLTVIHLFRMAGAARLVVVLFVVSYFSMCAVGHAQEHQSVDILAFCRHVYGAAAGDTQVRAEVYSWSCTVGARRFPIDVAQICVAQYGGDYTARFDDPHDCFSWYCVRK